jgi:hyperosmotically inducible periplasmic protein
MLSTLPQRVQENAMRKLAVLTGITLVFGGLAATAAGQAVNNGTATVMTQGGMTGAVDNSGVNIRDRNGASLTPGNQSNLIADRELLAAVRRSVVHEKALSTAAHNVKIMAANGVVTLRGPVQSDVERRRLEQITQQVAGVTSVVNELDIKTN